MERVDEIDLEEEVDTVEDELIGKQAKEVRARITSLITEIESLRETVKTNQKKLSAKETQLEQIREGDWSAVPEAPTVIYNHAVSFSGCTIAGTWKQ